MHLLHVVYGTSAMSAPNDTTGTASLVSKGTGYVVAATLPFIFVFVGLVFCLCALVPVAQDSTGGAKSSLLSQPQEVIKGPGRYLHIKGRMRLAPGAAFTPDAHAAFVPVEMWFSENPSMGWCITTPGALAYCVPGHSAMLVTDPASGRMVTDELVPISYCPLPFIGYFMWGRELFPVEGSVARCRETVVTTEEVTADNSGCRLLCVTIQSAQKDETATAVTGFISTWFDPRLKKMYVVSADNHDLREAKVTTLVDSREIILLETEAITYSTTGPIPVSMQEELDRWLSAAWYENGK